MSANPFVPILRSVRQRLGLDGTSTDGLLLERYASSKDEVAFAALVERHAGLVWNTCLRVTRDDHAAEDAFQATWIVLSRKATSLRNAESLPGWLHRVAFRLALAVRAKSPEPMPDVPAEATRPQDEASARESRAIIDEEVNRLPAKYRLPVLLCFFEGRTHTEAAAELGLPVGTVASRVARAKDLLHARLTRRGLAPSAWLLPLAATWPVVSAEKASKAALELAAAFLASGLRARLFVLTALILLPALALVAVFAAAPRASRLTPVPDVDPEPPPIGQIIPRNRIMHKAAVLCVAISRDGRILASGGWDRSVKLWDVRTCKELATFAGHASAVSSVALSRDGNVLASASHDKTVKLWDVKTHRLLRTLEGHNEAVHSVAFAPDGDKVASASSDKTVKLWEVNTGKLLTTLAGHTSGLECVAYAPDGKTIAWAGLDAGGVRTIRLWDVNTGKTLVIPTAHRDGVASLAFSPDGNTLASGGRDNFILLWDVKSGKEAFSREEGMWGSGALLTAIAFSPDGMTMAAAFKEGTIRLWDVKSRKLRMTLRGHLLFADGNVYCLAFTPDGKTLASGSGDRTVKFWDVKSGREQGTPVPGMVGSVISVAYSPDGTMLAWGRTEVGIGRLDVKSGKQLPNLKDSSDVTSMRLGPDGKTIAASSSSGAVKVWDAESGEILHTWPSRFGSFASIAYSPDGKLLASVVENDEIKIRDVKSGKVLHVLRGPKEHKSVLAFSPDGQTLAEGRSDNLVSLWEVKSGKELHTLKGHICPVSAVAFSVDGKTLATGTNDQGSDAEPGDNPIKLWDVKSGKLLRTLENTAPVFAFAFAPDRKTLASASGSGTRPFDTAIRLWDLETHKLRSALRGHAAYVRAVAFSPDGITLASGGDDGTVKFWDVSE